MFVIKRSGETERVKFDKVTKRVEQLCTGLDMNFVNPVKVAQKVISSLTDMISTQQLDLIASTEAGNFVLFHPDYAILSGRLAASNLQKEIKVSFSKAMTKLYDNYNENGEHIPIISTETFHVVTKYEAAFDAAIVPERDFVYDVFGFETLRKSYFLRVGDKIWETPQYMMMRMAIGIVGDDLPEIIKLYDVLSKRLYTHATPTIFNSGTPKNQMASCFLIAMKEDSVEGIMDTNKECAIISKYAGGIGLHVDNIRPTGAHIKGTNGTSSGLVPFLRVLNSIALAFNQGGKRKGSIAVYIEPHHPDIEMVVELRKNNGEEELRARDLFVGLWYSDLFMKRVEEDGKWSLFDVTEAPGLADAVGDKYVELYERYEREGRACKVIEARKLYKHIITCQIETGTPYMANKDQSNLKSNQSNLGTIKSSNLCVAPETPILTSTGYHHIKELKDQHVDVWNGEQWSPTTVRQTGADQSLIKVALSNGSDIQCTPYHGFCIVKGWNDHIYERVEAKDLVPGMKLIKHELPVVEDSPAAEDFPYAYTHGFFCGDGTYQYNKYGPHEKFARITLYADKKDLIEHLDVRTSSYKETDQGTINVMLAHDMPEKFTVPMNYSMTSKLEWFAGLCDSDDTVHKSGDCQSIQIASTHESFLVEVMLMLQTMGVHSKVAKAIDSGQSLLPDGRGGKKMYDTRATSRLLVDSTATQKLLELGFSPNRLLLVKHVPKQNHLRFVTVLSVTDEGRTDDTYCFTEKHRGLGMFGGVLTFQCCEINEYSDSNETAVCNLASLCLPHYVKDGIYDFQALSDMAMFAVKNLNKVIDRSFYPVETTRTSNMKHRPLGLGVSGLHDTFHLLKLAFESDEAAVLNKKIFETIYRGAIIQSIEEAKIHGPYSSFVGSPASKGKFQFDLWDDFDQSTLMWPDWNDIRASMVKYGLRNSLLVALMPTASSATIAGVTECFEAQTSNLYSRKVLSGQFTIINRHLVSELVQLGIWDEQVAHDILRESGSVANIDVIPSDIKRRYKTVWEHSMRTVIDMSADRGPFICQSQSLNLHVAKPTVKKLISIFKYGHARKLKTLMYYLRTEASTKAIKFTVGKDNVSKVEGVDDTVEECLECSA
jgi:ribonucleoside-diphosphate reductase alpha chain